MHLPRSLSVALAQRPSPRPAAPPEPAPEPTPASPESVVKPCRCGHENWAHQHYRRGTDCALCPCAKFRKAATLLRWGLTDERSGAA